MILGATKFNARIAAVALHDMVMAALSFEAALQLRYWLADAPQPVGFLWQGTLVFAAVCGIVFWTQGLYRGIWHYASFNDLVAIVRAASIAVIAFLPALFVANRLDAFPRSSLPITWALLIAFLTVPRFLYRALKDGNLRTSFERIDQGRVPVLVVGAGDEADAFIREMSRTRAAPYQVVGIVDDRPGRVGRDIRGVRVLGLIADLPAVVAQLAQRNRRPHRLVLAGDFTGAAVRGLVEVADLLALAVARVPHITDFREGGVEVRKVDVEDLLGRPQQVLDRDAMQRLIAGRRVLVTGAGGTIGGELSRQVAAFGPARLVLFDNGELNLFNIDLDVGERFPGVPRGAVLGDVRDPKCLAALFQAERPELVFHAAAFKHVTLSEQNPDEAILTNAIGTRNVAEACRAAGTVAMVLISTDKAVNASSVMGASKRAAEIVLQALSRAGTATRFVTVRFGNVLGSTGSVIPLFQRQLAHGGPIKVTHPDVTRYFMTVREAVELVLQATAIPAAEAGSDSIFVLDMGEPVRIQDLAKQMIRLSGKRPGVDVQIEFIGLRPGEKLSEELSHGAEDLRVSRYPGIRVGTARAMDYELLRPRLERLERAALARRPAETLTILGELVPEYRSQHPSIARPAAESSGRVG